jgi:hypothetical protein
MSIQSCFQRAYIRCHSIRSANKKKKRGMMEDINVSRGTAKMDKMMRRRELPSVRHLRPLYGVRVVCDVVPMSMERKKVMKKQRRSKRV